MMLDNEMDSILNLDSQISSVNIKNIANLCNILTTEKIKHLLYLNQINIPADINTDDIALAGVISGSYRQNRDNLSFVSCDLSDLQGNYSASFSLQLSQNVKNILPLDSSNWNGLVIIMLKPDSIQFSSKENSMNKVIVTVNQPKHLLLIGKLKLFGFCESIKKDNASLCKIPVEKHFNEHCVYHSRNNNNNKNGLQSINSLSHLVQKILMNSSGIDNVIIAPSQVSTFSHPQKPNINMNQSSISSKNNNQFIEKTNTANALALLPIGCVSSDKRRLTIEEELDRLKKKREGNPNPILQAMRSTAAAKLSTSTTTNDNNNNNNTNKFNSNINLTNNDNNNNKINLNLNMNLLSSANPKNVSVFSFGSSQSNVPIRSVSALTRKVDALAPKPMTETASAAAMAAKIREEYRRTVVVGNALVDSTNLMRNAPKPAVAVSAVTSSSAALARNKLNSEIDCLLARKSLNASEEDDEWFNDYSKRMHKLSQREFMEQKTANTQHITIKAFQCTTCDNFITENMPSLCREKKHTVVAISTVKRFFECGNCKRRENTLGGPPVSSKLFVPPAKRCQCGNLSWVACGPRGSFVSSSDKLQDGRLVMGMSDWTTARDKLHLADRVDKLR